MASTLRPWPIATGISAVVALVAVIISIRSAGANDDPRQSDSQLPPGTLRGQTEGPTFPQVLLGAPGSRSASYGPGDAIQRGGGSSVTASSVPFPGHGCGGTLSLRLVNPLDLATVGLTPVWLSSGFDLTSLTVRSEAECTADGKPGKGEPVLDTSWVHRDSGLPVTVTQRPLPTRSANVISESSGVAWSGGFQFTVTLNFYGPYRPADGIPQPGSPRGAEPAIAPGEPYPGGPDPRTAEVLRLALKDLAPSVAEQCYARETKGNWADLAAFGIGDPRPALPAGLDELYMDIRSFTKAAAPCGEPALVYPYSGVNFSASFGRKDLNVGINVYSFPPDVPPFPGNLSDYGANWISKGHQLSVYGNKNSGPLGKDAILKIARAMDPTFDQVCLLEERAVSAIDLALFGLAAARAPGGYSAETSEGRASTVSSRCTDPTLTAYLNVNFHWTFKNADRVIEANLFKSSDGSGNTKNGDMKGGNIGPNFINWSDGNGVSYSVNGYSREGKDGPSQEELIAVAKSMDPTLDPGALTDSGGGAAPPIKPR